MRVLVLNGPNLNMLGVREKQLYGTRSYSELVEFIKQEAAQKGIFVRVLQYNYEGRLITAIQRARGRFDAIILNAAAYTFTSIAILDALKAVDLPVVDVHLTDIGSREDFRKFSYVALYAEKVIVGKGFQGYAEALEYLSDKYGNPGDGSGKK